MILVDPEIFNDPVSVTVPDPLSNIEPVVSEVGPVNIAT
jgi:hypothetical protein